MILIVVNINEKCKTKNIRVKEGAIGAEIA
jgi:hypothetical protein